MHRRTRSLGFLLPLTLLTLVACSPADNTPARSALSFSFGGSLMTFGGQDNNCVAIVGSGAGSTLALSTSCGSAQKFLFAGRTIQPSPNPSNLCLNGALNTSSVPGKATMATCDGSLDQQWDLVGGQITSADRSDARQHCLGVHNALHTNGTALEVWYCDQSSNGQTFWPAGTTMSVVGSLTDTPAGDHIHAECLDVLGDDGTPATEKVGATLDDTDCNYGAGVGQFFVLDQSGHVTLANDTTLALALNGTTVTLQSYAASDPKQQWFFVVQSPGNPNGGIVALQNKSAAVCLDVQGGNSMPKTPIDAVTCNGTAAQRWQPVINVADNLTKNPGPVLATANIYQVYFGSWWLLNQLGHEKKGVYQDYVKNLARFVNGEGHPMGQVTFLTQYGVTSAKVIVPTIQVTDSLTHTQLTIQNGSIKLSAGEEVLTISNFTSFDETYVGGTVTLMGAQSSNNNRAFIISEVLTSNSVNIRPTRFDIDPADGDPVAGDAQVETFSATNPVQATISKPGMLTDLGLRGIVTNLQNSGQIPKNDPNALVMIFPSVDFTPNRCEPDTYDSNAPPYPDTACDHRVSGAYHDANAQNGTIGQTAWGVVFERGGNPVSRMEGGISHEIFEALTDPFYNLSPKAPAWMRGDGKELVDLGCNVLKPGDCVQVNGIDISTGPDNTLGGYNTATGYNF
jgi:hypothetical protein